MKNITVTVDDDLYRRARIRAAEDGITVSAKVKQVLRDYVEGETEAEARARRLRVLFEKTDAALKGREPAPPPEPGWRHRLYDERFDETKLGRSLRRPQP